MIQTDPTPMAKLALHDNKQLQSFKRSFQALPFHAPYSLQFKGCIDIFGTKDIEPIFLPPNPKPCLAEIYYFELLWFTQIFQLFVCHSWLHLKKVILVLTNVGVEGAEALVKCEIPNLQVLYVYDCKFGDLGVEHLSEGKWPNLKSISIYDYMSLKGLVKLSEGKWSELEKFQFASSQKCFGTLSIKNIVKIFNFSKLKLLNINHSNLVEQNIAKVIDLKLPNLQKLVFLGCPISGKQIFNPNLSNSRSTLKQLTLGNQTLRKQQFLQGLSNICLKHLPKLRSLLIQKSKLSKLALKQLTKTRWTQLISLSLANCQLNQESIDILLKCEWRNLRQLILDRNPIQDKSLDAFKTANFPHLASIQINHIGRTLLAGMNLVKLNHQVLGKVYGQQSQKVIDAKIVQELLGKNDEIQQLEPVDVDKFFNDE